MFNQIFGETEGLYIIFSQFTLKQGSNALTSRVNVKRLSIEISRMISSVGYPVIFENYTKAARDSLSKALENKFSFLQQTKAISSFRVICDDTNNTTAEKENE
jgi:phage tail sheath protein FI